ncbi:MAG: PPK2 family polyphosphate kinase [Pseudomonadota bacterium]
MFEAEVDKYRVPYDGTFRVADFPTRVESVPSGRLKDRLKIQVERIATAQKRLYADDRYAILLVFQAMDAAGKDSTIRHALSGVNPAWCHVVSFKKPTTTELDHDFLWRSSCALPERGRIGVFNRSHYEEVLVVRVHPEILKYQRLPDAHADTAFWEERLRSIESHERHLAANGTIILKFWLNVSRREQAKRFLDRLENPDKQWKFQTADVDESEHWPAYMQAYEAALNATSRPWAPWYAIPADHKPYMRYRVARTIADTLESLDASFPTPEASEKAEHDRQHMRLTHWLDNGDG